jgi:hypothetical protein
MIEPVCHNIVGRRNRVIISQSKMSLLYIITWLQKAQCLMTLPYVPVPGQTSPHLVYFS